MELKPLLDARGRFVSEAGSEQSTNFRWWDSRTRSVLACRLDLNNPPTSVGGIPAFSHSLYKVNESKPERYKYILPTHEKH
jgi:hypothetical protein